MGVRRRGIVAAALPLAMAAASLAWLPWAFVGHLSAAALASGLLARALPGRVGVPAAYATALLVALAAFEARLWHQEESGAVVRWEGTYVLRARGLEPLLIGDVLPGYRAHPAGFAIPVDGTHASAAADDRIAEFVVRRLLPGGA